MRVEIENSLTVRNLSVEPIACPFGLNDVSFDLRAGEILGIATINNNGQDELVAALTGQVDFDGSIQHTNEGAAVILVSQDLDELLVGCDRILVLFAGRLVGIFDASPAIRNQIGMTMCGLRESYDLLAAAKEV